jgi:hypothetical protein
METPNKTIGHTLRLSSLNNDFMGSSDTDDTDSVVFWLISFSLVFLPFFSFFFGVSFSAA